ncbi:MAG: tetratricopeptide repeat protein [Pseudomonadota bacterium]
MRSAGQNMVLPPVVAGAASGVAISEADVAGAETQSEDRSTHNHVAALHKLTHSHKHAAAAQAPRGPHCGLFIPNEASASEATAGAQGVASPAGEGAGQAAVKGGNGEGPKYYSREAYSFRKAGEYEKALELLHQGLRLYPNNIYLLCSVGKVYRSMGMYGEALVWFEKAKKVDPGSAKTHIAIGRVYLEQRRFAEGLAAFRTVLEIEPGSRHPFAIIIGRAITHREATRYKEALELLQLGLELYPNDVRLMCGVGKAYQFMTEYDEALKWLERAVKLYPGDKRAHTALGQVYRALNREAEALAAFRRALEIDPDDRLARVSIEQAPVVARAGGNDADDAEAKRCSAEAAAYRKAGRYTEALGLLKRELELYPHDGFLLCGMGETYRSMGKLDEAIRWFKKAVELYPRNKVARTALGQTYWMRGQIDDALAQLKIALGLDPRDRRTLAAIRRANLARSRLEDPPVASAGGSEAENAGGRAGGDDSKTYSLAARDLMKAGRHEDALKVLQRGLGLHPRNAYLLCGMGDVYLKMRMFAEAVESFKQVADLATNEEMANNGLGRSYLAQRKFVEALAAFDATLKIDLRNQGALIGKGKVYLAQGKVEAAKIEFLKALAINPSNPFARHWLTKAQKASGAR